ncbi:MAG: PQQ-binding-like beta-propeller repeat protein [candidate division WOR-3 bacterium]
MNWKKLSTTVALCLVLFLVVSGSLCKKLTPPETPGKPVGPDSTWQGAPARFEVTTTQAQSKEVRYVMNWGDGKQDTTVASFASGAKASVYHAWSDTGHYKVKALAILNDDATKASDWSEEATIRVLPNSPPLPPEIDAPLVAVKNVVAYFSAVTTDPDGNDVGYQFDWGDGKQSVWSDTLVGFLPGNTVWRDTHTYTKLETVSVRCRARDVHKTPGPWSDPVQVVVGLAGGVKWWWWTDDENQYIATTSAAVIIDEGKEYIVITADDGKVYGIDPDGKRRRSGSPVQPEEENEFEGHPAYCAATRHLIIGNSDGELYAFKPSLAKDWHWPGHTHEDSLTYVAWGTAAINGNKIYVPSENDSLYYFTDLGTTGRFEAAYYIPGMVDAPVIDAGGYVYIGTGSGQLYKMPPNLASPVWVKTLQSNSDIHSPAIGSDGTIYCGTSSGRLFAVNQDGTVKWNVALDGEAYRVVISPSALFVATGSGKLYCLNPATGSQNWFKQYGTAEIVTSPILAGDYVYYQDSDDILYCLRQSDGYLIWSCDCIPYGPGKKARRGKPDFFEGQPAILSNGDVVLIGADVMYCVAGYPERPLMSAPWPKWQKDAHNSGKASAW